MKKFLSLLCVGALMLSVLSGCSSETAKINAFEQENEALKKELNAINEKYRKELEIRQLLNKKSFEIIHAMKNKDIEVLEKYLSKETACADDKISSKQYEYLFSSAISENRLQTYWNWEDESNLFYIGYSIMKIENGIAFPIQEEEFEYRLENGEWKLVGIAQQ
ncbi:hypothetical protein R9X47_25085 [Wukongibacter baidiensis]|uniref:hypothetical protein n=1 Tax=Wukongibacter baidiensis TaxID=1723361 RepID=UPI003D7F46FC